MFCGTEAGSYLRFIDSCITQLKAQGPSRTCNESEEEEEALTVHGPPSGPLKPRLQEHASTAELPCSMVSGFGSRVSGLVLSVEHSVFRHSCFKSRVDG